MATDNVPAQYLTFTLGDELFAMDISTVREIIQHGPMTIMPMSPDFVRGVIKAATLSKSRLGWSGRLSANTIRAPWRTKASAEDTNVKDGTMTSPFKSSARLAISSATVALHTGMQCFTPSKSFNRCSNSCTHAPRFENQRRS